MCKSILNRELHSHIWVRSNLMALKVPKLRIVYHEFLYYVSCGAQPSSLGTTSVTI